MNVGVLLEIDQRTALSDGEVREILDDVRTAGIRASELTSQLLGFARSGNYEENTTDFATVVAEVLRLCKRTFDASITVRQNVRSDLFVRGDRSQLHQVLMNLLLNARDSMPDGGELKITGELSPTCAQVILTVSDTGVGMTPETKNRIFEPFFTTKGLGRGNGLGLATVYGIVRNHGGDIEVDSALGRGTTFRVLLPHEREEATGAGAPTEELVMSDGAVERGTILIVDDDPLNVRSLCRLLEQLGYVPMVARDGNSAVTTYNAHRERVQAVLLDVALGGMSGEQTCAALKAIHPDVSIIAMSGYTDTSRTRGILTAALSSFSRSRSTASRSTALSAAPR